MRKIIIVVSILVTFILFASCTNPNSCTEKNVQQYVDSRDLVAEKWVDAVELADSTARISLAPQIDKLQEIKREASAIEPPDCLNISHSSFIIYMDKTINSFMLFMQDAPNNSIFDAIDESNTYLQKSSDELEKILECVPNCD